MGRRKRPWRLRLGANGFGWARSGGWWTVGRPRREMPGAGASGCAAGRACVNFALRPGHAGERHQAQREQESGACLVAICRRWPLFQARRPSVTSSRPGHRRRTSPIEDRSLATQVRRRVAATCLHEGRDYVALMAKILTDPEKRKVLKDLIRDFDTAMLVTRTPDGGMRSRPLAIADSRDDGGLYFATSIESPKVAELEVEPRVNVALQGKAKFVSVTGEARIERDRALIDQLWSESWKVWFPQGKDDPSLCIVTVEPSEAAYWDNSGVEGVKYLFENVKAFVTGKKPSMAGDESHVGRVKLP